RSAVSSAPTRRSSDLTVLGPAEPVQRGGQEVGAAREPADEEVRDDEPGPVRRAAEEGVGHQLGPPPWPPISSMRRLRRPTSVNTPSTAALANENEALLPRLRDGSTGFRGSPYTSGSSTRR